MDQVSMRWTSNSACDFGYGIPTIWAILMMTSVVAAISKYMDARMTLSSGVNSFIGYGSCGIAVESCGLQQLGQAGGKFNDLRDRNQLGIAEALRDGFALGLFLTRVVGG